jgi:hypothetical protein
MYRAMLINSTSRVTGINNTMVFIDGNSSSPISN